ncbi:OmpA family protein [Stenotrophomonas sp. Marseille-Q4652]|uniref:OmpA family protein n=1 Tax=Stenotrophomonas sp. Marseille-Q4652 TaxID=2866595 RepID=UPI0009B26EE5|nr:OmpA family protein [Stenotrophomonas sp. Marseille-Q4652]
MAADNAAAWPRDAEIPLTDVRSVPKTGLARPPPTQQTARKGRLNFLYAQFMREYPLTKVVLEGHTDDRGSEAYNQQLSEKRAAAVAGVLVERFGIDRSRVSSVGYGESSPIVSNDTAENRARNRRVTAKVSANVETIKR